MPEPIPGHINILSFLTSPGGNRRFLNGIFLFKKLVCEYSEDGRMPGDMAPFGENIPSSGGCSPISQSVPWRRGLLYISFLRKTQICVVFYIFSIQSDKNFIQCRKDLSSLTC